MLEKKISITNAALTLVVVALTSVGSCVAWATQFQTKVAAAQAASDLQTVKERVASDSEAIQYIRASVDRIESTLEQRR